MSAIPVEFTEAELQFAEIFGKDPEMLKLVHRCPQCQGLILATDNAVWLDAKPVESDPDYGIVMGVMRIGSMNLACSPGGDGGSRHTMHTHQPEENDG